MSFQIGDKVEVAHDAEWQKDHEDSDMRKAKLRGVRFFMGNAAAYLHTDEAYVVVGITKTGGLRLRGFCPQVSPKDVRLSTKPNYR